MAFYLRLSIRTPFNDFKFLQEPTMSKRILVAMTVLMVLSTGCCMRAFSQAITLEQVIRDVCTKSDSVKMMNESVKKADQMVREKWANALPVISATGAGMHTYGSAFGGSSSSGSSRSLAKAAGPNDPVTQAQLQGILSSFSDLSSPVGSNVYTAGISFNQPLYTFGKVGTAIDVAKSFNKSAKASYERNMQTLQLGALDIFFLTLMTEKKAGIAERSLARKKELNDFLTRNFQNGSGSKAQVLKTKADVADQIAQTIVSRRDARVVRMNLNAMMGRQLTDTTALDTVASLEPLVTMPAPKPDDAVRTALTDRRDIQSLKFLSESNKGGAKIFRAMYLPSIAATGSAGYTRMESDSKLIGNTSNPNWSLGVGAQWTLFDGFSNSAKAAQYQSDANKLDIVVSTMEKMIEIEVRSALLECTAADSNLNSSKEMMNAALESYDLTNSNFKQGSGQFSDLQLADETLQQAELGMINARYRLVRSRAALTVAMGNNIVKVN
jgi:outer membrane protein